MKLLLILLLSLSLSNNILANPLNELFDSYQQAGIITPKSEQGKLLWNKTFITEKSKGKQRSCNSCHGSDVRQSGEHIRTGKLIEPMSKKTNSKRFNDVKKVKKWFKRNCKWTLGRECTAQEQANILTYLTTQ